MKFSIDKNKLADLQKSLEQINKEFTVNSELEWRLGKLDKNFEAGIFPHVYEKLLIELKKQCEILNSKCTYHLEASLVTYYDDDIREIKIVGSDRPIYQKKTRLHNTHIILGTYGLRLSSSTEYKINHVPTSRPLSTRERTRHVFQYSKTYEGAAAGVGDRYDLKFNIELSKIISSKHKISLPEVEIEFITPPKTLQQLLDPLKIIFEITDPDSIYLIDDKTSITQRNNLKKLNLPSIQPENIKKEFAPQMAKIGYSTVNKLDGIGYTLCIFPNGIFMINKSRVECISTRPLAQYHNGTFVLYGEWWA